MYIRPEFEKELKKLRIKTAFIKNFNDQFKGPQGTYKKEAKERRIAQLNTAESFRFFIGHAFVWKNTPQGYDFWLGIFKRYKYYLNEPQS